jgi:hypothetical protein
MRLEHRGIASSVAYFMLEAVGIVSTVLSLRSAGIAFGDAEVGHSFCDQLCTFAWFTFLAGLIGCYLVFPNGGMLMSNSGSILLLISVTVGLRGRGVFLIFAALSATCLIWNTVIDDFLYVPHMIKIAIGDLVSHATRYLCHQRLAFCIVAQPTNAAPIGMLLFAALSKVGFSLKVIVALILHSCRGATVV